MFHCIFGWHKWYFVFCSANLLKYNGVNFQSLKAALLFQSFYGCDTLVIIRMSKALNLISYIITDFQIEITSTLSKYDVLCVFCEQEEFIPFQWLFIVPYNRHTGHLYVTQCYTTCALGPLLFGHFRHMNTLYFIVKNFDKRIIIWRTEMLYGRHFTALFGTLFVFIVNLSFIILHHVLLHYLFL